MSKRYESASKEQLKPIEQYLLPEGNDPWYIRNNISSFKKLTIETGNSKQIVEYNKIYKLKRFIERGAGLSRSKELFCRILGFDIDKLPDSQVSLRLLLNLL